MMVLVGLHQTDERWLNIYINIYIYTAHTVCAGDESVGRKVEIVRDRYMIMRSIYAWVAIR